MVCVNTNQYDKLNDNFNGILKRLILTIRTEHKLQVFQIELDILEVKHIGDFNGEFVLGLGK